ncbi:MAG: FimB/Mfa2 family fimbrial subunit [Bacteroides sp.]|nr:FimB/Mfa2 family fimbrial subunit [Bacteroides sp.]
MTNIKSIFLVICLITALSGCDVKDPIYNTDHPGKGKVTLTTDWSNRSEGIDIPSSYKVVINNQNLTFNQATQILPELEAGTYQTLIYNTPDKITINGTIATVNTENSIIDVSPGWLFSSLLDIKFVADTDGAITALMKQQVRQLTFELSVKDGNPSQIISTIASLSGIANTLNISTGEISGNNLSVKPVFILNGDKLTANMRLIGVTGTQEFNFTVTFSDGNTQIIETNLTEELAGFNTGKDKTFTLTGDLNIPVEAGFGATITGWKVQTGSSGVAW